VDPAGEFDPAWSPDDRSLIFNSNRRGTFSLYRRRSDGSGEDELVAEEEGRSLASPDWSPDGKVVIFSAAGDLWIKTVATEGKPSAWLQTPFTEGSASFSPDGRFVVHSSNKTGRSEVYVRPFPSKDPEYKISVDGGNHPRWRNPREIVFLSLDGTLMSAAVVPGESLATATPRVLFRTTLGATPNQRPYDVARDGSRFVMPISISGEDLMRPLVVWTNWTARLRR
jgi:serine/threonine-protein kinase